MKTKTTYQVVVSKDGQLTSARCIDSFDNLDYAREELANQLRWAVDRNDNFTFVLNADEAAAELRVANEAIAAEYGDTDGVDVWTRRRAMLTQAMEEGYYPFAYSDEECTQVIDDSFSYNTYSYEIVEEEEEEDEE